MRSQIPAQAKKPSAGSGADIKALFLDFDGVLHPTLVEGDNQVDAGGVVATPLFGWLPLLVALLKPHPHVVVVVHSTWRYTHNLEELRELLGELGARVVGTTPNGQRYESIRCFLQLNPFVTSHRIVDDALGEFPDPPPSELILCNPRSGVSSAAVLSALQDWLGRRP